MQALPSGLHAAAGAQAPWSQLSLQHCAAAVHAVPLPKQPDVAHVPPTQLPLQQSVFAVQADASLLHALVHTPPVQVPLQQSEPAAQTSPTPWQTGSGAAHFPASHRLLQQSAPVAHAVPSALQLAVHTPLKQLSMQQSAAFVQVEPMEPQVVGGGLQDPPEQSLLQQSAPVVHDAPVPRHWLVQKPLVHCPLQHSELAVHASAMDLHDAGG